MPRTTTAFLAALAVLASCVLTAAGAEPALDEQEALKRMGDAPSVAWIDGGTLYAAVRAEAEAVFLLAAVQEPLSRLDTPGLWGGAFPLERAGEAAMSCGFGVRTADAFERMHDTAPIRGPGARPAPPRANPIEGTVTIHTPASTSLGQDREVHVYLPPNTPAEEIEQVVYLADGQGAERYAQVLEPLITAGLIPPTAIIGVASDTSGGTGDPGKDHRATEYLVGFAEFEGSADPQRFDRHWVFFTEEVPAWAERELGIRADRDRTIVAGSSNGGAFAATVGARAPARFGASIVLSSGWLLVGEEYAPLPDGIPGHRAFFSAGVYEPGFLQQTRAAHEAAKAAGYTVTLDERVGGHDPLIWQEQLVAGLLWLERTTGK